MAIELTKVIELAKKEGIRAAILVCLSAVVLGVGDQFTARIVPKVSSLIENLIYPPQLVLQFSDPVDLETDGVNFIDMAKNLAVETKVKFQTVPNSRRTIIVNIALGDYILILTRKTDGQIRKLNKSVKFQSSVQSLDINTSDSNWEIPNELALDTGNSTAVSPADVSQFLVGTRWSTIPEDYSLLSRIESKNAKSILAGALAEVGTYEFGSLIEKNRIAKYWKSVPSWTGNTIGTAWGSAFLSWAVERSDLASPMSASYLSWKNWGVSVAADKISPGMIVIYSRPGFPESSSMLVAGIVLRVNKDCMDIITGNVADRVVITCVTAKPVDVRWKFED